jgi:GDP-4-dehydro-6-deoxy-D-mannose reductase
MRNTNLLRGKILITGISGFFGKYLCNYLSKEYPELKIYGIDVNKPITIQSNIKFIKSDITDYKDIKSTLNRIHPDIIFHLAGIFNASDLTFLHKVNVIGSENVISVAGNFSKNVCIILASSASVYGSVRRENNPIKEEINLHPTSHYGISKLSMEMIGKMYAKKYENLKIITARTFNLIGHGLSNSLLPGKLAENIFEISRKEGGGDLRVGNINSIRDFIDIKDAVKAFCMLAVSGKKNQAYNVGSGNGEKIKNLIDLFIKAVDSDIEIIKDQSLFKDIDAEISVADITKIREDTGWAPVETLEKSISDIIKLNFS